MLALLGRLFLAGVFAGFYLVAAASFYVNPAGAACLVAALAILSLGLFVLLKRPTSPVNRSFMYFSVSLGCHVLAVYALHMGTAWGLSRVESGVWLLRNGSLFISPSLMYFTYRYLEAPTRVFAVLTLATLVPMTALAVLNFAGLYVTEYRLVGPTYVPANAQKLYALYALTTTLSLVSWWVLVLTRAVRVGRGQHRRQLLVLAAGSTFPILAGLLGYLPLFRREWFPSFMGVAFTALPVALAIGVLKLNMFDIKLAIRRTLPYAMVTGFIGGTYALVLVGLEAGASRLGVLPSGTRWVILLAIVGLAFQPTLEMLQKGLDRLFFREEAHIDRFLAGAGTRHRMAESLHELGRMVAADARSVLMLEGSAVLFGGDTVSSIAVDTRKPDLDCVLGITMAFSVEENTTVDLDRDGALGAEATPLVRSLQRAGVRVAVPFGHGEAKRLLLCNRKLSDTAFSQRDRMFLRALVGQAELAEARIRASAEADRAHRMARAVLQSMTNPVATVSSDGEIVDCNPAFEAAFAASRGDQLEQLGLRTGRRELSAPREIVTTRGTFVASTKALEGSGDTKTFILVLTDVTDLRRLQQAARKRESLAEIGAMISSINHEIVNILSPVAYYLERAKRSSQSPETARALDSVTERIGSLDRLTRELREYYREPALSLREVKLGDVVRSSLADLAASAGRDWVAPQMEGLDLIVSADPQRLRQVMVNLLKNAWEAMGGTPPVQWSVRGSVQDGRVKIRVQDSGSGIGPDVIGRVFEPFFTTKKGRGSGLGLAISQRIAEAHGAEIEVESLPGRGTAVTLDWPLAT